MNSGDPQDSPVPLRKDGSRDYPAVTPRAPEDGLDLSRLFHKCTAIELEIGFGRGMFLFERCASAPASGIFGIEIKSKWAYLVQQRCERLGLDHVKVVAGDSRSLLPRLGPDGVLQRVFVHFPDPWWKKRHNKRRVVGSGLLHETARLLAPGGELFVQTDVEDRAKDYRDLVAAHGAFELQGKQGLIEANPYGARSNREKRADEDGLPVYRVLATRR